MTDPQQSGEESAKDFFFNVKSEKGWRLSNLVGPRGAIPQCLYEATKFAQPEVKEVFFGLDQLSDEQFRIMYKHLSGKQADFWYMEGKPIYGILAKMLGRAAYDESYAPILQQLAGVSYLEVNEPLSPKEQAQMMLRCMKNKYKHPGYRGYLLTGKNCVIHEKPIRGSPNMWTLDPQTRKGNDLTGLLLMYVMQACLDAEEASSQTSAT